MRKVARPLGGDLALLKRIVQDGGAIAFRQQAVALGLPISTAYRLLAQLVDAGWVSPMERGFYGPGAAMLEMAGQINRNAVLAGIAAPLVRRLAKRLQHTVHFGVFEDDMVTYLLKEGPDISAPFSQVGMQLEAYCSGIGKVLLAHLPDAVQDRYLHAAPFVALTPRTVTEPSLLKELLVAAVVDGYALDDREMSADLCCIAVPVQTEQGVTVAALSISRLAVEEEPAFDRRLLKHLQEAAQQISARYWPPSTPRARA